MGLFWGNSKPRHRVCIVGGGFSGLHAAQQLPSDRFEVTIFDPRPHLEWLPNIHEILSGVKRGDELRVLRQPIIERLGHAFRLERVADIGPTSLTTASGEVVPFDVCIVGTGGINDSARVRGSAEHGLPFKSVDNCMEIAKRLRRGTLTHKTTRVTVVGGGIEGVEALGEMLRAYRYRPQFEFQVVDGSERLLKAAPGDIDSQIRRHTSRFQVEYHLGQRVDSVEKEGLTLANGKAIESDITIWTGGVAPNPLLKESNLAAADSGWGAVNDFLQSQYPNVFVIGDAAQLEYPLGKQAFHAIEMGQVAGQNTLRLLQGKPLLAYKPSTKPQVVTFGDLDAFMIFDGFALSSSLLGVAKEAIFTLGVLQLSPPRNARDAFRQLDILQRSVRNVYLPGMNPLSVLERLPKSRLFRA